MTTASKDCGLDGCVGTAFWDTACQDYVCQTCGQHDTKDYCSVCGRDRADDEGYTIDPEEADHGA